MFRGDDGLDELTTTTTSSVWVVSGGEVTTATVDPARPGLAPATTEHLRGGDAAHNADVVRRLLDGEPGPVRDAVLLNAGAALAVYDARRRRSTRRSTPASRGRARPSTPGREATLERWVAASASLSPAPRLLAPARRRLQHLEVVALVEHGPVLLRARL